VYQYNSVFNEQIMITIKQLLNNKDNQIWSVEPKTSIFEALKIMSDKEIGALLVLEEKKLVGIFSEQENTIQQLENYITGTYR
jgi:CBS domain-containing protein